MHFLSLTRLASGSTEEHSDADVSNSPTVLLTSSTSSATCNKLDFDEFELKIREVAL